MKETGLILKQARERQSISLEEVAMAIKIKVSVLKAIESGSMDQLPQKAFVRGFVQTYASFLKLDVKNILDSFHHEMGTTAAAQDLVTVAIENKEDAVHQANSKGNPALKLVGGIGAAVLIVSIIVIFNIIQRYEEEAKLNPDLEAKIEEQDKLPASSEATDSTIATNNETSMAADPNIQSPEKTTDDKNLATANIVTPATSTVTIPATTKPTSATLTNSAATTATTNAPSTIKPIPVANVTTTAPKIPNTIPSSNSIAIVPPKKLEDKKLAAVTPAIKTTTSTTATPSTTTAVKPEVKPTATVAAAIKPSATSPTTTAEAKKELPKKPQEVIIEALDKLNVRYKADNGNWINVKFEPDQIQTFRANSKIELEVSDGGAINIIHNGRDTGVPGVLGEKKKLTYQ